jgi:hypothetical protein
MTARLNDQDWEMLSAFIDGQLSLSDQSRIKNRLQTEPALNAAYQSLINTRINLKAIPRVKRRRNFYLSAGMIHTARWNWVIPIVNFGSMAAAVMAVLLFILNISPLSPVMNRAYAPVEAATREQGSTSYFTPTDQSKGEINPAIIPDVNKSDESGAMSQEKEPPVNVPLPMGKVQETSIPNAREPATLVENPPLMAVPPQSPRTPADSAAPAMKAAPAEMQPDPTNLQLSATSSVEGMPPKIGIAENTNQTEAMKIEPAGTTTTEPFIEPTTDANVELIAPTTVGLLPAETRIAIQPTQQKMAEVQVEGQPAINSNIQPTTSPTISTLKEGSIPSRQQLAAVQESRLNFGLKIGWITLLVVSGLLGFLGYFLKKKLRS